MSFKKPILAIIFSVILGLTGASFAEAMTNAEIQDLINKLQQQIIQLQQQLTTEADTVPTAPAVPAVVPSAGNEWCYDFKTKLEYGNKGIEVGALYFALTKQGFYAGEAADNFGTQMALAVSAFQEKYASEILTPWRLSRGTGYVGSTTLAKLTELYGCGSKSFSVDDCTYLYNGFKASYETSCKNEKYVSLFDFNKDGKIDILDFSSIYTNINNESWCEAKKASAENPCAITTKPTISICSDGTAYNSCSNTKPKYCQDGALVDKASVCNCSAGLIRLEDSCIPGTCFTVYSQFLPVYGSSCGQSAYNYKFDFDKSGVIDATDNSRFYNNKSNVAWCQAQLDSTENPCATSEPSRSIIINSPDGEEQWSKGATYEIKWKTVGALPIIEINLYKSGSYERTIVSGLSNNGTYSWTIPNDVVAGNVYRIKVKGTGGDWVAEDYSNGYYSITGYPSACTYLYNGLKANYETACGNEGYNATFDFDKDGDIDIIDHSSIYTNINNESWCEAKKASTENPCLITAAPTCSDGTAYNSCSSTKPKYCQDGVLVEKASVCGCSTDLIKLEDSCIPGTCFNVYSQFLPVYGSSCGKSTYNYKLDFDKSGVIDATDNSRFNSNKSDASWCQVQLDSTENPCEPAISATDSCPAGQVKLEDSCIPQVCSDVYDVLMTAYGASCSSSKYDLRADFNESGGIDITDFTRFATNKDNAIWCQQQLDNTTNTCPTGFNSISNQLASIAEAIAQLVEKVKELLK